MDLPLWYRTMQRQLSFSDFEERYHNQLFQEKEVLPILVLSALYGHDPYVGDIHILQRRINAPRMNDRALRAIYLYWVLGRSFRDDCILSGNAMAGTFQRVKLSLPDDFHEDHLYNWASLLLRCFFVVGPMQRPDAAYRPGNLAQLMKGLAYIKEASGQGFEMGQKTVDKAYRLSVAHERLKEVRGFFRGEAFPSLLRPYRRDRRFFESVVQHYWPAVLRGLELEAPFDEWELERIQRAHRELHLTGDLDFYLHYAEKIDQIFGRQHPIALQPELEFSPAQDARQIQARLGRLDPDERRKYFLQRLAVSDRQLSDFVQAVETNSFEQAILPYLQANRKRIDEEISLVGGRLANQTTLATQTNVYFYDPDDLVFHSSEQTIYVFLKEELAQFRDRTNPYDRQPLPDRLFRQDGGSTEPIDERWQRLLRRKVEFPEI